MAEGKETNFKITDRRKFNADGTPRDLPAEPIAAEDAQAQGDNQTAKTADDSPGAETAHVETAHVETAQAEAANAEAAQSNVVSFPGDTTKKKERADSQVSPEATAASDRNAGAEQSDAASVRDSQVKAAASAAEQAYNQMKPASAAGVPEASFLGLLDMLAGEAAMCLGMVKNPSGAEIPTDLDTARQVIDMLGMLQQKTRGNLNAEEADVLENILAYLRMQFVALSRNK